VTVLAEVARGSDNDIETVNTSLDSDLGIIEMASYVSENLGLELMGSQRLIERDLAGH
jgi:hypothetical protein